MKLQINTLEALQKLISEDPDFEIEIKQSIINKIAKSYIKSIENNEVLNKVKNMVDENLYDTKYSYKNCNQYIKGKFNNNVKDQVQSLIKEELNKVILTELHKVEQKCINEIKKQCNDYIINIFPTILAQEFLNQTLNIVNGVIDDAKQLCDQYKKD
jgi:predicted phosphohydrolase